MRVPQQARQTGLRFQITPLIDVVFLLVIFFLVATHFVQHEAVQAVELPVASQGDEESDVPRRLVISVAADRTMSVKDRRVTLADVELMIAEDTAVRSADYAVRIRADQSVPYDHVEPIMLACLRAGVTRFEFAVREE